MKLLTVIFAMWILSLVQAKADDNNAVAPGSQNIGGRTLYDGNDMDGAPAPGAQTDMNREPNSDPNNPEQNGATQPPPPANNGNMPIDQE